MHFVKLCVLKWTIKNSKMNELRSWHLKSEKQTEVPSYFVDWWNAKSWSRRVRMKKGFLQCCFAFMAWLFLFFFQINVEGTNKRKSLDSLDYKKISKAKGLLNSEWDHRFTSRAEILQIFGWHFGRNEDLMNSFWI